MNGVLVFFCLCSICAAVIVWKKDCRPDQHSFSIESKFIQDGNSSNNFTELNEKQRHLQNYTLDEKCERGMDIGIGFQMISPYSNFGDNGDYYCLHGMFPHIAIEIMKHCCQSSKITYGHFFVSMLEIEEHFSKDRHIDISFPIYGLEGKQSQQYKDFPFIPVVTSPRIVLVVPDQLFAERNTRTQVLMNTVFNAWPMLVFIIASACLAGLTVWLLDKKHNSSEFPPTFFAGAWEGIWWAFVTMTTVGYGDRSPKSTCARAFCIIWILMGIMLISLFTGLVSAALLASATPVFNVAGASIGALIGSIEYEIGVGMNAHMIAYNHTTDLLNALINKNPNLHGALLDNFILSANQDVFKKVNLRMEREIDHPVTYGFVIKNNSSKMEKCFRNYVRNFPHKTFQIIAKYLVPISNPVDEVRLEVAAAEKLFYEESIFRAILCSEVGILTVSLLLGVAWEMFVRNKNSAAYRLVSRFQKKPQFSSNMNLTTHSNAEENMTVERLILEYDDFHLQWMSQLRNLLTRKNGQHTV
ncbi:uncharacterized protein LOC100209825 isoform X3 [Hydra vulgaris]|uniref:Uncharacterized protein LOC100209825 isoform X3 n=1 Tax=Hydra vulgaris TaxID=6087 RepID=A0ABM4BXQ4_HYDVU